MPLHKSVFIYFMVPSARRNNWTLYFYVVEYIV